ncbi:MAG: adenylate/guanylate cyclase domain-containing protein [Streptosporangiales bacterium]|nr:adenylate/guanylate cyclase domain-containing protein [Streptosporangiales bacterium]
MTQPPDPDHVEEVLLGAAVKYTREEAIREAGVEAEFADRLWQALGFPRVPDGEPTFTEGDVNSLRIVRRFVDDGVFDEDAAVRLARAMGQTMARLAEWQLDILASSLIEAGTVPDAKTIQAVAELLVPEVEEIVVHVWRRQLGAAGARAIAALDGGGGSGPTPGRVTLTVGFADLVSFTTLSRELDEIGLAQVVEGFESVAADTVAEHGGRIVKTLGDEVLFVADRPEVGAEIALRIAEAVRTHVEVPDVRVGMAYGSVVSTLGDVFGTTVNLASRLTSFARPGTVLVDAELAGRLLDTGGYRLIKIVRRPARGLGLVQPYVLRRAR